MRLCEARYAGLYVPRGCGRPGQTGFQFVGEKLKSKFMDKHRTPKSECYSKEQISGLISRSDACCVACRQGMRIYAMRAVTHALFFFGSKTEDTSYIKVTKF